MTDRDEFLKEIIGYLPAEPTCIELGVYRGELSRLILDVIKPYKLVLVDPWTTSYDKNGSETYNESMDFTPTAYSSELDYVNTMAKLTREIETRQVLIYRKYSYDALEAFPDHFFDFIYIDACHLYECIKSDLNGYLPKLKPGGLMCGHDYIDNYGFGVVQAVDEFIVQNNFEFLILNNTNWALRAIK